MKLEDKQTFRVNNLSRIRTVRGLQELKNSLDKARNELFLLRLDIAQNKLKNTRSLFLKRKEIALTLTLIREKELGQKSL